MHKLRTLIVDDEPIARLGIRMRLEANRDFEIVGECTNGLEAVEAIRMDRPDLVFLDVLMPEMDGFEVVRTLGPRQMPAVIFVTAYDQHAIRAFEVNAVDYLLKPVDGQRFDQAIERARSRTADRNRDLGTRLESLLDQLRERPKHIERFVVKNQGKIYFVEASDVDWIEAAGNYIMLHAGRDKHMVAGSISNVEGRLDPDLFRRIHRSIIVNTRRIKELHPLFHGEYRITLLNGIQLESGRRYSTNLREFLKNEF